MFAHAATRSGAHGRGLKRCQKSIARLESPHLRNLQHLRIHESGSSHRTSAFLRIAESENGGPSGKRHIHISVQLNRFENDPKPHGAARSIPTVKAYLPPGLQNTKGFRNRASGRARWSMPKFITTESKE
jgi:hypothetical protein